ncbi:MAG: hypothetical protein WCH74_07100 [Chloroflexota bacterium]
MRSRLSALITVLALLITCLVPASVSAATPTAMAQYTTTFTPPPGSAAIEGWYWMRQSDFTDVATWTFDFDPAQLSVGGKSLYLYLTPLVTQAASGGAGWKTRVKVNVTYVAGGKTINLKKTVNLTNPFPLLTTASSGGIGYQTYGTLKLPQGLFKNGAGSVTVAVLRDSASTTYGLKPHVAVRGDALAAFRYVTP